MYEKHTDGRLIAELSDKELVSILSGISTQIAKARKVIGGGLQSTHSMVGVLNPEFSAASRRKKAEEVLRFLDQSFKDYLAESVLRGLECSKFLQDAYGRNSAIVCNQWQFSNADILKNIAYNASIPEIK